MEEHSLIKYGGLRESGLRESWLKAKEEGRLTGCGLIGEMTMDDIEDMRERVDVAMTAWQKLAGCKPSQIVNESELLITIKDLTSEMNKIRTEMDQLRADKTMKQFEELKAFINGGEKTPTFL